MGLNVRFYSFPEHLDGVESHASVVRTVRKCSHRGPRNFEMRRNRLWRAP